MPRDARLRMRNALVIPGVLLTFYGLLAIIYAEQFRAKSDFCPDSNLILIAGTCYTVWKIIMPVVFIGIALIIPGLTAFRGKPEQLEGHLHHGTAAHSGLALLISLFVVPLGLWIVQTAREAASGRTYELTVLGTRFQHTFLLELVMIVALLMLVPFLCLYISMHRKRRHFIAAATAAMEEDQEQALPHERGFEYRHAAPAAAAQSTPMVPDEEWPDERDGPPPEAKRTQPLEGRAPPASDITPCQGEDDGLPCPNPAIEGLAYCPAHACQGQTRQGSPCGNPAEPGESYCQVHLKR